MPTLTRILVASAATVMAIGAFSSAAEARHRGHHHAHVRMAAAPVPVFVPAHQRPEYVGVASASLPGIIDLGLGPVFPFGGWPN